MPTSAVSPLYIVSSDRAATGLTQPVPVVGTMTSTLRSKAPVRSSSLEQHRHPALVGVGGLQPGVDPDGLLGGPSVERVSSCGVRTGGDEVAALVTRGCPTARKTLGCQTFRAPRAARRRLGWWCSAAGTRGSRRPGSRGISTPLISVMTSTTTIAVPMNNATLVVQMPAPDEHSGQDLDRVEHHPRHADAHTADQQRR